MNEYLKVYIEDLRDNLMTFNDALMTLSKKKTDMEAINSLFRAAHTIKGNSAAVEFFKVEKVMHSMEDILHEVRQGKRELTQTIINLLYEGHDFLEDFLDKLENGKNENDNFTDTTSLIEHLAVIKQNNQAVEDKPSMPLKESPADKDDFLSKVPRDTWEIILENMKHGLTAHNIKVHMVPDSPMKDVRVWLVFNEVSNYALLVFSIPTADTGLDSYVSNIAMNGDIVEMIVLCEGNVDDLYNSLSQLIDITKVDCVPIEKEQVQFFLEEKNSSDVVLPENVVLPVETVAEPSDATDNQRSEEKIPDQKTLEQKAPEQKAPDHTPAPAVSTGIDGGMIRVPVSKVDNLLDMLGEFMILNSQLTQQTEMYMKDNQGIMNTLSRSAKIIRSIQDLSMSLRLIEIKNTMHRLNRIIRDTANELGKSVNISLEGENTEIDRSAAEKLFDPLMHLVRNAVSHGIETPEERVAAGKSPEGNVEIKAYSKRGHVYMEVNDDGKGMDPKKILAKAIKLGMAAESENYSNEDIIKLIFKPGFSTQEKVNNISGRGVGMNVVDSELKKIGGKIDIVNRQGEGCSFIVRIPMNLALINGTIVEISGERYIIPT